MTGIAGCVGVPDPNLQDHDPNDPNGYILIGEALVYALQDGQIIGSALTGLEGHDNEGSYFISRLEPGTYDLRITAPNYAVQVVTGISVQFGFPTVQNFYDLVTEGRIAGFVTGPGEEPLEPNKVHVSVDCGSGILLMVSPDSAGNYVIGNVPEGTYIVEAFSLVAEFPPNEGVSVTSGNTTADVDFAAIAVGEISGVVKDSQGQPIEPNAIAVAADDGRGTIVTVEPNSDGAYTLGSVPEGTYTVSILSAHHSFDPVPNVVVIEGETTAAINLQALSAGTISGTVTESDGITPITGASVALLDVLQDRNPPLGTTDVDGDYVLHDVPPGAGYTVVASLKTGGDPNDPNDPNLLTNELARITGVTVTQGEVSQADLIAPGGAISGGTSPSVEGALVRARGEGDCVRVYQSRTDSNGDYTLTRLPADTYEVSLEPNGFFAPKLDGVQVGDSQTSGHGFSLTPEGAIAGRVADASNDPIAGAIVTGIDPNTGPNSSAPTVTTNTQGYYVIQHLAAGNYTVYVDASGHDGDSTTDITVTAGQTTPDVDFSLTTTNSKITGTVYESDGVTPIAGAFVSCYGQGLTHRYAVANETGSYELGWVMPGTYTVAAVEEGFQGSEISDVIVPSGCTTSGVDFHLDSE